MNGMNYFTLLSTLTSKGNAAFYLFYFFLRSGTFLRKRACVMRSARRDSHDSLYSGTIFLIHSRTYTSTSSALLDPTKPLCPIHHIDGYLAAATVEGPSRGRYPGAGVTRRRLRQAKLHVRHRVARTLALIIGRLARLGSKVNLSMRAVRA